MIVALFLPEGLVCSPQQVIGLTGGVTLQSSHELGNLGLRSNEHVDVIGHEDPGMKLIISLAAVMKGINDDLSNGWHREVRRSDPRFVE